MSSSVCSSKSLFPHSYIADKSVKTKIKLKMKYPESLQLKNGLKSEYQRSRPSEDLFSNHFCENFSMMLCVAEG